MHFFLLLFIPAVMGCLISTDSEYSLKKLSAPLFIGFFSGIIVSAFIEFFVTSESNPGSSFFSVMLPMTSTTFMPAIVLSALFFFFSKDDIEYKNYAVLPLLGAFHSIYIPYMTLTHWESSSFFMNFASPALYIETIILFSCALKRAVRSLGGAPREIAISAAAAVLSLLVQPSIHALWFLHLSVPAAYALALAFLPASIFVYKFFCKR